MKYLGMATHLRLLAIVFLMVPSGALAAGPTVTDWKDSSSDPDTVTPASNKLNAVHGRSRPNSPVVSDSSTEYTVWAVGNGGIILRNRPSPAVGWEQVTSPTNKNLNDVYINSDGMSGWAVGDDGTILTFNGSVWTCVQCPSDCDGCGDSGQPLTTICTCTDLYDIIPLAPQAVSSSLFVVGRAADNPPSTVYGEGWPTVLYCDGTNWEKVTRVTSPWMLGNLDGYFSHDPDRSCDGDWIESEPSISYTGLMIDPLTHVSIESTICRMHLQTVSDTWYIGTGRQTTSCTTYFGHYYSSAVIGSIPVIGGDMDCGDLFNTKGIQTATNLFFYNTSTQKVQALNTGIQLTSTLWGTIRGMDFIPTLRWGIGVGWGPGDSETIGTTGTNAYFVRFDYKDLLRLPAPEDASSPNQIFYENASYAQAPYNGWPRMNGVFISNYNEAWAVGDNGKVLHWLGPPIMPASLKADIRMKPAGRPVSGQWVDIILSVTNTGDTTAIDLNPGVAFNPLPVSQGIPVPVALQVCGPTCATFSCGATPFCATDLPARGTASFTWTYSMTACAPYLDRISASIYAADFVTGNSISASDWIDLPGDLTSPALQVSVSRSPSGTTISRDSPISYVITVRNTGGITLSNLAVWDSVAVPIAITATNTPTGFVAAANPFSATGRLHYFYNFPDPITMPPNMEYTFTLTGVVGRPCTPVSVSNRVGAIGWNFCTNPDNLRGASAVQQFDVPGPAQNVNLVVTATRTGGTNPGQPIGYRIVVANGGSATIENLGLLVADTVPAVVSNPVLPAPPPGFGQLPPADVPGGTWYAWRTLAWTDMAPGETYTFTITGTVGGTCVDVLVSGTPWISGSNFCQSGTYFIMSSSQQTSAQTDNFLLPGAPPIEFDLSVSQDPSEPGPGDAVKFVINIRNVGVPAITNLSLFDSLPAEIDVTGQDSDSVFSYNYNSVDHFIAWWCNSLNMANGDEYSFTLTGSIGTVCETTAIDRGFEIDALSGDCGTTGYFSASATPYVIPVTIGLSKRVTTALPVTGQPLNFEITLSNTGKVAIDLVTLWDSMPPELMPPITFAPPGFTYTRTGWPEGNLVIWSGSVLNLPPGDHIDFSLSGTFGITCQATDVINNIRASAVARPLPPDSCSAPIVNSASASFPIQSAPMAASISLEIEERVAGNNLVTVLLTISNTGSATTYLEGITPAQDVTIISSKPEETTKIDGPTPDIYTGALRSINSPCETTPCLPQMFTFKWTYLTTSIVPVTFVASATAGALTNIDNLVVCGVSASATTKFSDAGPEGMFALDRNIMRSSVNHVTVSFNVKEAGRVRINVFNSLGQKVRSLFDDYVNRRDMFPDPIHSGVKECDARKCPDRLTRCACWDGTNDDGERVASGVYFIRLEAHRYVQTRKIAVVK